MHIYIEMQLIARGADIIIIQKQIMYNSVGIAEAIYSE
jgi:hypothetical protein